MTERDLLQILQRIQMENCDEHGWTDLVVIGKELRDLGIDYKELGFPRLKHLIAAFPDYIETYVDSESHVVPKMYARMINSDRGLYPEQRTYRSHRMPRSQRTALNTPLWSYSLSLSEYKQMKDLKQWAYLPDYEDHLARLADMALPEPWSIESDFAKRPHQLLYNYINDTYARLVVEQFKIVQGDAYAVFNTGLVDKSYRPIYALFGHQEDMPRFWTLEGFGVCGVGEIGRVLEEEFEVLPEKAQYAYRADELVYFSTGRPWIHVKQIVSNYVLRFPKPFVEMYKPRGFELQDTSTMSRAEWLTYAKHLSEAIVEDEECFEQIKNALIESANRAFTRLDQDYKIAVPAYLSIRDRMCFLLPLTLLDDPDRVDVVLMVERNRNGSYSARSVFTYEMAYRNARLVAPIHSSWLQIGSGANYSPTPEHLFHATEDLEDEDGQDE